MSEFHYRIPVVHCGKPAEWVLSLNLQGGVDQTVPCGVCHGDGKSHGMWADEDQKCHHCYGSGKYPNKNYHAPEPPPQWLIDQLAKVMRDAWNRVQNEEFRLY
jgi:hypothetical protein